MASQQQSGSGGSVPVEKKKLEDMSEGEREEWYISYFQSLQESGYHALLHWYVSMSTESREQLIQDAPSWCVYFEAWLESTYETTATSSSDEVAKDDATE